MVILSPAAPPAVGVLEGIVDVVDMFPVPILVCILSFSRFTVITTNKFMIRT